MVMPRLRLWLMYQVNFGTEAHGSLWICSDAKRRGQECRGAIAVGGGRVGGCTVGDGMLVCGCRYRGWVKVHTRLVPMGFRSENHGLSAASQFTLYIL